MHKILFLLAINSSAIAADQPIANGSLTWPIDNAEIKDTTTFFGHHDSAGIPNAYWCSGKTVPPIHLGVDISAAANVTVKAIDAGTVRRTGSFGDGSGWYVVVESGSGTKKWTALYGHLNDKEGRPPKGKTLKKGDTIGTVYDMHSDGDIPHLHLGIRNIPYGEDTPKHPSTAGFTCANSVDNFVNPLKYLPAKPYIWLDDADPGNKGVGTWSYGSYSLPFYFGTGYQKQLSSLKGSFSFSAWVAESGNYNIYAKWPLGQTQSNTRDASVIYTLWQGGTFRGYSRDVNQGDITQRAKWVPIFSGQYLPVGPYYVTVSSRYFSVGKIVVADGILIQKQ